MIFAMAGNEKRLPGLRRPGQWDRAGERGIPAGMGVSRLVLAKVVVC